jgi:cytochrome P450
MTTTLEQAPRSLADIRSDLPAPGHVPRDRIVDLNWAIGHVPNDLVEPYAPVAWLLDAEVPRILFDPTPGIGRPNGQWAVAHYDDIRRVYEDNEYFSTKGVAEFQAMIGETFHTIPLALDPPEHGRYRKFLNTFFTPVAMKTMEGPIRDLVNAMIDEFADKGEVDIAYDFARVYPVRIFMNMMRFPDDMFDQFLDWEFAILHSNDPATSGGAMIAVIAWLRAFIAEKEANPDDGLTSKIVNGTIGGAPLTADEKIGILWLLWLGGLDTVASTISQMFRRLGQQPDLQAQIRGNPELINSAVEEFLRTQPLINSTRMVRQDFTWHGVDLKAGDHVMCLNSVGNFDPTQFGCPRQFDATRPNNRHFTLIGGVHLCLGAHLARRELRILLDEWFRRIPAFRIKPDADTTVNPGLLSIRNLPLVWEVAVAA